MVLGGVSLNIWEMEYACPTFMLTAIRVLDSHSGKLCGAVCCDGSRVGRVVQLYSSRATLLKQEFAETLWVNLGSAAAFADDLQTASSLPYQPRWSLAFFELVGSSGFRSTGAVAQPVLAASQHCFFGVVGVMTEGGSGAHAKSPFLSSVELVGEFAVQAEGESTERRYTGSKPWIKVSMSVMESRGA